MRVGKRQSGKLTLEEKWAQKRTEEYQANLYKNPFGRGLTYRLCSLSCEKRGKETGTNRSVRCVKPLQADPRGPSILFYFFLFSPFFPRCQAMQIDPRGSLSNHYAGPDVDSTLSFRPARGRLVASINCRLHCDQSSKANDPSSSSRGLQYVALEYSTRSCSLFSLPSLSHSFPRYDHRCCRYYTDRMQVPITNYDIVMIGFQSVNTEQLVKFNQLLGRPQRSTT